MQCDLQIAIMESSEKLQLSQDLVCISVWGSFALDRTGPPNLGHGAGMKANSSGRPRIVRTLRASRYRRYDSVEGLTLPLTKSCIMIHAV